MGMTIDEALNKMPCLMEACSHCLVRGCDKPIEKIDEAKIVSIDTMRKYQKIQEIAFPLQFCSTDKLEHEAIMEICEVLEDGKID